MAARNPRNSSRKRNVKTHKRHVYTKPKRSTRKATPRNTIKSSPGSSPNVHNFTRGYSYPVTIGTADATHEVQMNTDSKYMILKLHTKFSDLPDFTEFKALFSEYKITSITHRLVPYYSNNLPSSETSSGTAFQNAIPNFEIFILPVHSSAREKELHTLSAAEIDSFLNQSQRKGRRLMPSKTQTFTTLHPKVVGYSGPVSKAGGTAVMTMTNPTYFSTDPAPLVTGGQDQTTISHYGSLVVIRRVDGAAFLGPPLNPRNAFMGCRMETQVYFRCRRVQ